MYDRNTVLEQLRSGVVMVSFLKKDGTLRHMRCTLNDQYLPKREVLTEVTPRVVALDTIAVYDIEANGWRSFNLSSVERIDILNG